MKPPEAQQILSLVSAAFPTELRWLTPEQRAATFAVYRDGLSDLDYTETRAAVTRLLLTTKRWPAIADIRESVGVIVHGPQLAAVEAWAEVDAAIRDKGSHRTPGVEFSFADPITARVVRALGWRHVCTDAIEHIRARFLESYEHIAKTERKNAQASRGAHNPQLERGEQRKLAEVIPLVLASKTEGKS